MGRGASAYERELKGLLQGDRAAVTKYGRALDPVDRAEFERATRTPFLVIRAAGSFGFDLVALRQEFAFPVEVKASSYDTIRFSAASGRAAEQLAAHRKAVDRVGLIVLYAFRRIGVRRGDTWRIFVAPSSPRSGRLKLLLNRLPPVESTAQGNGVLRWENGTPLSTFVRDVAELTAPPAGSAP